MKRGLAVLALSVVLPGCAHPLLIGRVGDNLDKANPYALCRARQSWVASDEVWQAIQRRNIDCGAHDGAIAADAARRSAALQYSASLIARPPAQVLPAAPIVPIVPRQTNTMCTTLAGGYVSCTTQ